MRTGAGQYRLWRLVLVFCAVIFSAQGALAWTHHSFSHGYALSLPDDWVQIPDDALAIQGSGLPALRANGGSFDIAFQPKRNGKWFEYPYMLIEVVPYAKLGHSRQMDSGEVVEIVKSNTGLDPANPFTAENQVMEGGGELETLDGVLNYDRERQRFMWSSSNNLAGVGLIRSRQWGFFGNQAVVHITLYERGRGSDRLRDMARSVAGSFKFEIGRDYQPGFTAGDFAGILRETLAAPSVGVFVTGGCVAVAAIFAVFALFSSRHKAISLGELASSERGPYQHFR